MKAMQLEVTKNCDRSKTTVVSNQSGFIEYCLKPLAELMAVIIQEVEEGLDNIPVNLKMLTQIDEGKEEESLEGSPTGCGHSKM